MNSLRSFFTALFAFIFAGQALAQDGFTVFSVYEENSTTEVDNTAFASFLETYASVDDNGVVLVNYRAAKSDSSAQQQLSGYISSLEGIDPTSLNKNDAFAYWSNLYNALTIKVILDNYPVKSIREIKSGLISLGPWGKEITTVNDVELSLNNIEHDILREFWDEPRVHYVVNCASIGCPNLDLKPWSSENLDARLSEAARAYINHPRGVSVKNGRITASSIFKWYKKDFGDTDAEVIDHWRQYADPALLGQLENLKRINKYSYDWSLNEKR